MTKVHESSKLKGAYASPRAANTRAGRLAARQAGTCKNK